MVKIAVIAFLFTFILCAFGNFNLTIIHISDFHSHWHEFDENKHDCSNEESKAGKCYGGFARLLTFVREIRKKEENVLVLSSGEFFMGKSLCPLHGWRIAHALLPKLELDAMSLSNHDFDSGMYYLSVFLYSMKFPVLCANMIARETSFIHSRVNKSVVLDVNGEKVGIVGYIHRHALKKSRSVASLKFIPEIPALQEEISRLESEGVNKIIALGHAGYFTDLEIAKNVKGVDIVMGGDSDVMLFDPGHDADELSKVGNIHGNYPRVHHQEPESVDDPSLVNRTLVLHIPQHGMYVGVLRASFDDNGKIIHESGEPVLLDSSIPQDEATLDFLEYAKGVLEEVNEHGRLPDEAEILGIARDHLDGNRRNCRMQECSFGNFIADAILHEFSLHSKNISEDLDLQERWGPIDAVVCNSGTILRSIKPGHIKIKDLLKSIYLGGFFKRAYMSGQQAVDMMEHSVKHYDPSGVTAPGSFLQIAGMKVEYDLSQPPGRRVRSLMIRCRDCGDDNTYRPIVHYKIYIIGMPNFMHDGRDGFYDFGNYESKDAGQFDISLIVEHLRRMYEVFPKLDGRIKFYKSNSQSNSIDPPLLFGEPALEYNKINGTMVPTENPQSFDSEKEENSIDTTAGTIKIKVQKEHATKPFLLVQMKEDNYSFPSHIFTTESSLGILNNSEEKNNVNIDNLIREVSNFKNVGLEKETNSLEITENDVNHLNHRTSSVHDLVTEMKDNELNTENSLNQAFLTEISSNLLDQAKNVAETYVSSMENLKSFENGSGEKNKAFENKENFAIRTKENDHVLKTEIPKASVTNNDTRIFNASETFELMKELINSTPENFKSSLEKTVKQIGDIPGNSEILENLYNLNKHFIKDWLNKNMNVKNSSEFKDNISKFTENLDKYLTSDLHVKEINTISNETGKTSTTKNITGKFAKFMKHILADDILSDLFKNHTEVVDEMNIKASN